MSCMLTSFHPSYSRWYQSFLVPRVWGKAAKCSQTWRAAWGSQSWDSHTATICFTPQPPERVSRSKRCIEDSITMSVPSARETTWIDPKSRKTPSGSVRNSKPFALNHQSVAQKENFQQSFRNNLQPVIINPLQLLPLAWSRLQPANSLQISQYVVMHAICNCCLFLLMLDPALTPMYNYHRIPVSMEDFQSEPSTNALWKGWPTTATNHLHPA